MAVKHDMVAENQNAAQNTQNVEKLQMLLRLVRTTSEANEYERICLAIVKCLCQEPKPVPEQAAIKQFNETLVAYRNQLNDLINDSPSDTSRILIHVCLKCLYMQIVNGLGQPSVAAGIILTLFDTAKIPAAVRWMLSYGENNSDEALTQVFNTLVRWLSDTTIVDNLHVWISEMLGGLFEERRFALLHQLEMSALPGLVRIVKVPVFRSQVLSVLQQMMVCDGGAPEVFHVMLPKLGDVIRAFNGQVKEQEIGFLKTIQDMILQFPETGERYREMNDILNIFKQKLGANSRLSTPVVRYENNNPRVGLVNLGNTCYMNSVLQALVMTKHFSRELLLSYPKASLAIQGGTTFKTELVLTIQKLLAQLLHSRRPELTPREVLRVTRPASFLPGHQQDSSEFLSHLMDTLHEHELAMRAKQKGSGAQQQQKTTQQQRRKRPATGSEGNGAKDEVDNTGINVNSRQKMEELQNQLMRGEEDEEEEEDLEEDEEDKYQPVSRTLIQRSFGGYLDTTYHCLVCGQKSTNRDAFRDVSLSFGMDKDSKYYVQHLLDYYCLSEKLEGDNQYYCDQCAKLCDGVRSQSFVAPPKNLILTLKHFKYDQQFHTRAKLMHNVVLNEMVTLKIHKSGASAANAAQGKSGKVSPVAGASEKSPSSPLGACSSLGESSAEDPLIRLAKYQLYAVVVHSGMSMDAGHYYTYASDEPDSWYMFNDSFVSKCSVADVHRLRAPNTPYILFYRLVDDVQEEVPMLEGSAESLPELEELPSYLKDFVVRDNFTYCQEMQKGSKEAASGSNNNNSNHNQSSFRSKRGDSDDNDDLPPPSSCGGNAIDSCNSYIC